MMAAGALMGGLALAGLSRADTLPLFYLFYILNALAYVCGGPLPCQVLIARRFDKNRGKAMGIAYLGIGAGGALVPLLAARLQDVMGWHNALLALGGLIVLLALPLPLILKSPDAAPQPADTAPQPAAPKGEIGAILRSPAFYLLAFGSMCSIGAVGGVMQHLKLYLRDQAFTQEGAARILSLVLLSSLVGRVLMGWLADRFSRKRVMILIYMLVACAIPLLLMPAFPGRIYLFALIFGIGLGGDYMIIPLMAGDLFGVRALGRVMGIILVADGVAESAFPMLVGALYNEATKSYALGFSVLIALALTGAILIALLPKQSLVLGSDQTR
jgi:MFS family permease